IRLDEARLRLQPGFQRLSVGIQHNFAGFGSAGFYESLECVRRQARWQGATEHNPRSFRRQLTAELKELVELGWAHLGSALIERGRRAVSCFDAEVEPGVCLNLDELVLYALLIQHAAH